MGREAIEGLITVATAIVGVAIIATLVSQNAQTGQVLTAGGQALGTAIRAATSPVTASGANVGASGFRLSPGSWTGGAPMDTILA
jgi:hypothetical protein